MPKGESGGGGESAIRTTAPLANEGKFPQSPTVQNTRSRRRSSLITERARDQTIDGSRNAFEPARRRRVTGRDLFRRNWIDAPQAAFFSEARIRCTFRRGRRGRTEDRAWRLEEEVGYRGK